MIKKNRPEGSAYRSKKKCIKGIRVRSYKILEKMVETRKNNQKEGVSRAVMAAGRMGED